MLRAQSQNTLHYRAQGSWRTSRFPTQGRKCMSKAWTIPEMRKLSEIPRKELKYSEAKLKRLRNGQRRDNLSTVENSNYSRLKLITYVNVY